MRQTHFLKKTSWLYHLTRPVSCKRNIVTRFLSFYQMARLTCILTGAKVPAQRQFRPADGKASGPPLAKTTKDSISWYHAQLREDDPEVPTDRMAREITELKG